MSLRVRLALLITLLFIAVLGAGMGLTGIRERVDSMNGELQLATGVNKGVSLTILLPEEPG